MNLPAAVPYEFGFISGALALDFTNTVGGSREAVPYEHLHSYSDILNWAEQGGLIDAKAGAKMARMGSKQVAMATLIFERGIALREACYRIVRGLSTGQEPMVKDLRILNQEYVNALTNARLVRRDGKFEWNWESNLGELEFPLWKVAASAEELITNVGHLKLFHKCKSGTCGWLFVDTSKNHSRRWCSMKDCGNRAKVRRHRARQPPATRS